MNLPLSDVTAFWTLCTTAATALFAGLTYAKLCLRDRPVAYAEALDTGVLRVSVRNPGRKAVAVRLVRLAGATVAEVETNERGRGVVRDTGRRDQDVDVLVPPGETKLHEMCFLRSSGIGLVTAHIRRRSRYRRSLGWIVTVTLEDSPPE